MEKISCVCRSSIGQRVFIANAQRTFALHIYLAIIHPHLSTTQKVKGHHEWIQTSLWVELKKQEVALKDITSISSVRLDLLAELGGDTPLAIHIRSFVSNLPCKVHFFCLHFLL